MGREKSIEKRLLFEGVTVHVSMLAIEHSNSSNPELMQLSNIVLFRYLPRGLRTCPIFSEDTNFPLESVTSTWRRVRLWLLLGLMMLILTFIVFPARMTSGPVNLTTTFSGTAHTFATNRRPVKKQRNILLFSPPHLLTRLVFIAGSSTEFGFHWHRLRLQLLRE
ncbi:MAG: hypothetical protein PHG85_02145 [Candidatus Altiarchaeota archaeon]|nr:hypothetical protein [Candidatus Altiarchaeota archaeon]